MTPDMLPPDPPDSTSPQSTPPVPFTQMTPEQRADLRERFLTAVAEMYRLPKRVLSGDTGPVTAEQARDMERFYQFALGGRCELIDSMIDRATAEAATDRSLST